MSEILDEDVDYFRCNDLGCEECDPQHFESNVLKWVADGIETLPEFVERIESLLLHYKMRMNDGWRLQYTIDGGRVYLELPRENV